MKLLELFAGSRSVGRIAESIGFDVVSTDIEPFDDIDIVCDIFDFEPSMLPHGWIPDVIWSSPPCTGFTVMQIGRNWTRDHQPKTDTARLGLRIVQHTFDIIDALQPTYWWMENPRGKLRKLDVMRDRPRHTVTYCQYGDTRMKPTDIWTNNPHWRPRPMCKNGDPCHESAPRGSSTTGTMARRDKYNRSKIPSALCREILESCIINERQAPHGQMDIFDILNSTT